VNSSVIEVEENKVKVTVEVPETDLAGAIEVAFKKIAKEVNLPGFRPGKVPRRVLEARFGTSFARGEALNDALPEFYVQAVRDNEIDVIGAPDFEIVEGEEEGDIVFEALVETRPLTVVEGYQALEVEISSPLVSDADVQEHIDSMRGQYGELATVERAAIEGDHVTIDISAVQGEEDVSGLTADDYTYELGSGGIVPEIDEALSGSSAGDDLTFDAEHPDPEQDEGLTFTVKVKEVQEKVLPDVDDKFVAEASEFETVAELTADVTSRLESSKRNQAASLASERTSSALAALVDGDVPQPLIDHEVQNRLQNLVMQLAQQGIEIEKYFEATGQSVEGLREGLREPAESDVRVDLALRHIARAEELVASDEDVEEEYGTIAEQMGLDVEGVREEFAKHGTVFELKADIGKRKAMEWLEARVTLTDEDGNAVDRLLLVEPEVEEPEEPTETTNDADEAGDDEA